MLIVPCSSSFLLFASQCSCCYCHCCWCFDGLVGDFSAQAVINSILHKSFPEDPIVGEEDSKDLRGEEGRQMREKVLELANSGLDQALTEESVCSISLTCIAIDALRFFLPRNNWTRTGGVKSEGGSCVGMTREDRDGNCGRPSFLLPLCFTAYRTGHFEKTRSSALIGPDRLFFFFWLWLLRWRFIIKRVRRKGREGGKRSCAIRPWKLSFLRGVAVTISLGHDELAPDTRWRLLIARWDRT